MLNIANVNVDYLFIKVLIFPFFSILFEDERTDKQRMMNWSSKEFGL